MEMNRATVKATWWQIERKGPGVVPPSEEVVVEISYESGTLYIEGLRAGHLLAVPLAGIAGAIVDRGPGDPEDPTSR